MLIFDGTLGPVTCARIAFRHVGLVRHLVNKSVRYPARNAAEGCRDGQLDSPISIRAYIIISLVLLAVEELAEMSHSWLAGRAFALLDTSLCSRAM